MKTTPPNQYRRRGIEMGRFMSTDAEGMNGAFSIPLEGFGHKIVAHCMVSDGSGSKEVGMEPWEHVSVHIEEYKKQRTPTWAEMCAIKALFWDDEEMVIQYHPAKKDYVNHHPNVLHLWRRDGIPTPPKVLV